MLLSQSQTREISLCDKEKHKTDEAKVKNIFVFPFSNNPIKSNQFIKVKTFYDIKFSPNCLYHIDCKKQNDGHNMYRSFCIIFK